MTDPKAMLELADAVRDAIDAIERNSTSAPVVECLKAALARTAAKSAETEPKAMLELADCPFCGSPIEHKESLARSFDPPRIYHEWCHVKIDHACPISKFGPIDSCDDDPERQQAVVKRWNRRTAAQSAGERMAALPKRPFAFAVRRAPENGPDEWRLFRDEGEAREAAEQLDGDYEALYRVGDRRSTIERLRTVERTAAGAGVREEFEICADGKARPIDLRTKLARAAYSVLRKPLGIETLDWEIADAILALRSPSPDAMREALEPFANLANCYDDQIDSEDRPVGPIALKFCRAARSALAQPQAGEDTSCEN